MLFFFIPLFQCLAQEIPDSWNVGNSYTPQKIRFKILNHPPPKEVLLYKKILLYSERKQNTEALRLAREFLRSFKTSSYKFQVLSLVKSLTQKTLQLHVHGNPFIMPGKTIEVFMKTSNIKQVHLELWKINLLSHVKRGIDIHNPCVEDSKPIRKWIKKIVSKRSVNTFTLPIKSPGVYILLAKDKDVFAQTVFFISHIATVIHEGEKHLLSWTTRRDGKPLNGKVDLYFLSKGKLIKKVQTNKNGIWFSQVENHVPMTVLSVLGEHVSLTDINWYRYNNSLKKVYICTNSQVYKAGEKITVKVVIRHFDARKKEYTWKKSKHSSFYSG